MLTGTPTKPAAVEPSKITLAAEELIKAACSHVETTSMSLSMETVENLKKISLNSVSTEKSIEAFKTSMDAKLNTLSESVAALKKELEKSNVILARHEKKQSLAWALANMSIVGQFFYYGKQGGRDSSADLIKTILLSFRQGTGYYIDNRSTTNYGYGNQNNPVGEKKFRETLSDDIHQLTGQKPRIAFTDDRYIIYYS